MSASLLELFREELRSNGRALGSGLAKPAPDWSELKRAAHSIRGAAHIVSLDAIETLAAAMEGALAEALASGAMAAEPRAAITEALERLGAGVEIDDAGIDAWQRGERPAFEAIGERLVGRGGPRRPARAAAPSSSTDSRMLELFRQETEAHAGTLGEGLLALENDPGRIELLDSLMRAAHSIKGAARVVSLDAGVELSHAMEDVFVAAKREQLALGSDDIDLLLRASDLLVRLAVATGDGLEEWLAAHAGEIGNAAGDVRRIRARAGEAGAVRAAARRQEGAPGADAKQRFVRVTIENIDRLMELSGETVVETSRLTPLGGSLQALRASHRRLFDLLEELRLAAARAGDPRALELAAEAREANAAGRRLLDDCLTGFEDYARRSDHLSRRLHDEAIASRMRPFGDALHGLARLVRDLGRKLGKRVELRIAGESVGVDRDILEKLEAPLNHLLRNAVDHGVETPEERKQAGKPEAATIRVEARHWAGVLTVVVADDGRGIDAESVRRRLVERDLANEVEANAMDHAALLDAIFTPGFSTAEQVTELSGRGVGLDVVRSVAQEVGGTVRVVSAAGRGASFHLQLPLTLSVTRAVVVEIAGEPYAFPLTRIERIVRLDRAELRKVENRTCFTLEGETVGLVAAHEVLGLGGALPAGDELCAVVLADRGQRCAVVVDRQRGEHDLVVRALDPRLGKVADLSAASILPDGTPLLILDVEDMMRSIVRLLHGGALGGEVTAAAAARASSKRVLVVDDSITVREVQRQLLTNHGYAVEVAVDGMDGWNALRNGEFDLVISDVDMPRMNGIDLVRSIKQDPRLKSIPVMIVSYKDREEDRLRGLEVGADYYLTKSDFHDEQLVRAVHDLVGEASGGR